MMQRLFLSLALVSLGIVLALGAASSGSAQAGGVLRLAAVQDVSFPFWCDWGYDWDERCYRDDGDRLSLGGESDKVWRVGLRFSPNALPPNATIVDASLFLYHDGACVGERKTLRPCPTRRYVIDAHPILSADWFHEREVDIGPALAAAMLPDATRAQWLILDLTDLVAEWASGALRNDGVLLKLSTDDEDYGGSGPKVPSASFVDPALRPRMEITYLVTDS